MAKFKPIHNKSEKLAMEESRYTKLVSDRDIDWSYWFKLEKWKVSEARSSRLMVA